jgi:signal transduction histidine kinase
LWFSSCSKQKMKTDIEKKTKEQLINELSSAKARVEELEALESERAELLIREQEARKEIERANRLKDEFLATVSHELRTPLTAILGWTRLVRCGKLDEAATNRALETVERNAKAQAQIVEDLLDISSIITGKLRLDVQPVDLIQIIEVTVDAMRLASDSKDIRLFLVLDRDAGRISGDPFRLQQIIWNLLSNAVKFTPNGGRVEVRLERVSSQVEIKVSDTGKGINSGFLPFLFGRFRQEDSTLTRMQGGLGLGLSIVRHLVELHGGTVDAESRGEGRGSTFTVRFPTIDLRIADSGLRIKDSDGRIMGAVIGNPLSAILTGLKIMVVEDDADTRELLVVALKQSGADVIAASSALEAHKLLENYLPNLLISDISMPDEDGYEFIHKIRESESELCSRLPAIALTAHAKAEDRIRALTAGYQLHISKPVDPAELINVVAGLAEWKSF